MATKRENERNGFKPDEVNGRMYDKAYYGLHVPDQEDFDYQNATRLRRQGTLPSLRGSPNMFKDGFIRIDDRKIKPANQSQFIDAGKVKRPEPSKTFSGWARKRGRRS